MIQYPFLNILIQNLHGIWCFDWSQCSHRTGNWRLFCLIVIQPPPTNDIPNDGGAGAIQITITGPQRIPRIGTNPSPTLSSGTQCFDWLWHRCCGWRVVGLRSAAGCSRSHPHRSAGQPSPRHRAPACRCADAVCLNQHYRSTSAWHRVRLICSTTVHMSIFFCGTHFPAFSAIDRQNIFFRILFITYSYF